MENAQRVEKVVLEYQPIIHQPPVSSVQLRHQATVSDDSTVDHWRDIWVNNIRRNKEFFGSFKEHSVGELFEKYKYQPCVVAGSGPSLKVNAHHLKKRGKLPLISCLHNFHYFEDLELEPEFYCSLDAGKNIVVEEVTEGGSKDQDWYWERTRDRSLVAFIGSDPELFEKWQGKVYLYNAPIPDERVMKEVDDIEKFHVYLSNGGNVLGACVYLAKGILGCYSTIFVGADFSFGYPDFEEDRPVHRFHGWKSKYDADKGKTMRVTDVFGNKVHTWASYYNFKSFFDWLALNIPGDYINATQGGIMGSYNDGNISAFRYMDLEKILGHFNGHEDIRESCENPEVEYRKILY